MSVICFWQRFNFLLWIELACILSSFSTSHQSVWAHISLNLNQLSHLFRILACKHKVYLYLSWIMHGFLYLCMERMLPALCISSWTWLKFVNKFCLIGISRCLFFCCYKISCKHENIILLLSFKWSLGGLYIVILKLANRPPHRSMGL